MLSKEASQLDEEVAELTAQVAQAQSKAASLRAAADRKDADMRAEAEQLEVRLRFAFCCSTFTRTNPDTPHHTHTQKEATDRQAEIQVKIDEQRRRLADTLEEVGRITRRVEESEALKTKSARLKQLLVKANAYDLHRTLAHTVKETKAAEDKLNRAIAAVEEDQAKVSAALKTATAERCVVCFWVDETFLFWG